MMKKSIIYLEISLDLSKILRRIKIFQFSEPELDKLYCQS